MSLFAAPVKVVLADGERETVLALPLAPDARGGWQDVARVVQARVKAGGSTSSFDDGELLKLQRYAYNYGGGGYQGVFRVVLRAAQRAGWEPRS